MASLLYAALFAVCATAADVSTSVWLPGAASANQTLLGSVVQQNGDQTVLSIAFSGTPTSPNYFTSAPPTVTVGGTTYVAYNVSASDSKDGNAATITIELQCRRPNGGVSAVPTCTLSTVGVANVASAVCNGLSTLASLPEYCTQPSAPINVQTQTFSGELQYSLNNYPLIITAGTEKLASVAATPRSSTASATTGAAGSGSASRSGAPSPSVSGGPGSGTAGRSGAASQTVSGASGSPQQATGAAAPMKTMVPALAGLGAAAAAFFL